MRNEDKYFRDLTKAELWQRYCGFLDFSVKEFMDIQRQLLIDQIERVASSTLGKKIMANHKPKSLEEFRRIVPVTTYDDYEPYLSEKRDDALAEKPLFWCHSSGIGGRFKWIPWTKDTMDAATASFVGMLILGSARRKGEVRISTGERMLIHFAPPPYVSGCCMRYVDTHGFTSQIIPPLDVAEKMEFPDRIAKGFQMALRSGVDEMFSIASVLAKVGEEMAGHARKTKFSVSLLHPAVLGRLSKGWLKSKIARRPMLPSDLWQPKTILTLGIDTNIYRPDIVRYWGQAPFEIYGGTEVFPIAVNAWNKKWLTFDPRSAFYEFISEEEQQRVREDPKYQPKTVLLDEVEVGKSYEIIITQFRGMPLLRYKVGDVVSIVALSDEEAGIKLPQMMFKRRADGVIFFAGLCRLDEKTLWQAVVNTGFKYEEWTARKEFQSGKAYLHFYLEPKDGANASGLEARIDAQLKAIDPDYRDIGSELMLQPVKVTLLSEGTFKRYFDEKRKEGADPAHMKPRHVNISDEVMQRLTRLSKENGA